MAENDHMAYTEFGEGPRRQSFDVHYQATFERGEPVRINNAGEIVECTTPVDAALEIYGISADSSLDAAGNNIVASGLGFTRGQVCVYPAGQLFKTVYYATDGAGTQAVPAQATVGMVAGFVAVGGRWFLDTGEEGVARVEAVLDTDGNKIEISGNTGVWVVYRLVASQVNAQTLLVDAAA